MKRLWLGLLGLIVFGACSRSTGPIVYYVEGRVLIDGQPLEKAKVGFSPMDGPGRAAFGETDAAGVFKLTTAGGGRILGGAPAGRYIVTIRKYRDRLLELGPYPDSADVQAAAAWQAAADRVARLPTESLIPETFGDEATSPLRAEVKKGRNTGPEFTFQLPTISNQSEK